MGHIVTRIYPAVQWDPAGYPGLKTPEMGWDLLQHFILRALRTEGARGYNYGVAESDTTGATNTFTFLSSRRISILTKISYFTATSPPSPPLSDSHPCSSTHLFSSSIILPFLRMLYEWNYAICNRLWLTFSTQHNFLLNWKLLSVSVVFLCCQVAFHGCRLTSVRFFPSPMEGLLCCFQCWVVLKKAALNTVCMGFCEN